jgi:ankyrin repeat protein
MADSNPPPILSEETFLSLDRSLADDAGLRQEFLLQAEVETHLRQFAQQAEFVEPANVFSDRAHSTEPLVTGRKRLLAWKTVSFAALAAAAVLLIALLFAVRDRDQNRTAEIPRFGNALQWIGAVTRQSRDIWSAARDGNVASIRREIGRGVSVNAKLEDRGLTPLHVAALFGRADVAAALIDQGAELSLADVDGNTALHMAAFVGNQEIAELLLDRGASVRARNALGFTPLDLVSFQWTEELESVHIELADAMNQPLDLDRIRAGRPAIAGTLRDAEDSPIAANPARQPPAVNIWEAAIAGNVSAIEQHVQAGTFLDGKESVGGSTPLILASIFGRSECAKVLIDGGANMELKNNSGSTALFAASFFGQPDAVRVLLEKGADTEAKNPDGLTPLDAVAIPWDEEMASVYRFVYRSLNIEFEEDEIKRTRLEIRELLRRGLESARDER